MRGRARRDHRDRRRQGPRRRAPRDVPTLVNARQTIPTFIALLTGISDSMLADAPPIEQVLPSLLEFVRGQRRRRSQRRASTSASSTPRSTRAGYPPLPATAGGHACRSHVGWSATTCRTASSSTLAAVARPRHTADPPRARRRPGDRRAAPPPDRARAPGSVVLTLDDLLELPRISRPRARAARCR